MESRRCLLLSDYLILQSLCSVCLWVRSFVCLFLYTTHSPSLSLSLGLNVDLFSRCKWTSLVCYLVATLQWGSGVNWAAGMVVHDHGCFSAPTGRRLTETTTNGFNCNARMCLPACRGTALDQWEGSSRTHRDPRHRGSKLSTMDMMSSCTTFFS